MSYVACGVALVASCMWHVACCMCHVVVACGMAQVASCMWHVACDMSYVACDICHVVVTCCMTLVLTTKDDIHANPSSSLLVLVN